VNIDAFDTTPSLSRVAKEIDSFTRNPIRGNFEPPKGVSVDRTYTNIERDAQKMVDPNRGRAYRKLLLLERRRLLLRRLPSPMQPNDHPEKDESNLLSDRDHQVYWRLIGILQWMVKLGPFDICYSVSSLSTFSKCTQGRTPTES